VPSKAEVISTTHSIIVFTFRVSCHKPPISLIVCVGSVSMQSSTISLFLSITIILKIALDDQL
jgi:hypothetical protein